MPLDLPTFMGMLIDTYLASPQNAVSFPKDIQAAAGGDWTDILNVFANDEAGPSSTLIMTMTIRCGDAWASDDPARVATVAPGSPFTAYEEGLATDQDAICKYWPHAVGASGPVTSSAPIVFLNGTADPVDPPANVTNYSPVPMNRILLFSTRSHDYTLGSLSSPERAENQY